MHINTIVHCPGCLDKFNKYPGFYKPLQDWFFDKRVANPTFHCADAGRGKVDQEIYFARGASNAHFGQSAHNANAGIDCFFQISGSYRLDCNLFDIIVQGLDKNINWYGSPDAPYKERPHFEWRNWQELLDHGAIKLVE